MGQSDIIVCAHTLVAVDRVRCSEIILSLDSVADVRTCRCCDFGREAVESTGLPYVRAVLREEDPMKKDMCRICNRRMVLTARGLCSSCYNKWRLGTLDPSQEARLSGKVLELYLQNKRTGRPAFVPVEHAEPVVERPADTAGIKPVGEESSALEAPAPAVGPHPIVVVSFSEDDVEMYEELKQAAKDQYRNPADQIKYILWKTLAARE